VWDELGVPTSDHLDILKKMAQIYSFGVPMNVLCIPHPTSGIAKLSVIVRKLLVAYSEVINQMVFQVGQSVSPMPLVILTKAFPRSLLPWL